MRRILFLLPDLDYRGHARQTALLASGLPRERFDVAVASLSGAGPLAEPLSRAGIPIHCFRRGHRLDIRHYLALRELVRDWQPNLIHVWGLGPLRTLRYGTLLRRSALPPILLSLPPSSLRNRRLSWWERRLLARVSRFIATCESDSRTIAAAGLPNGRTRVIRPGISHPQPGGKLDLPPGPILMSVGHMHGFGRLMDAVWVTEILSYVMSGLQLVVIGEGEFKQRVLGYFRSMPRIANAVHFLGARPDAADLFAQADVALIPHRRLGGTFTTLDAMAAGRAVVATRLPHLEAIIRDGETGTLATPVDQPGIARCCLRLLENDKLRTTLGAAARASVARDFPLDTMIAQFASTYDETCGAGETSTSLRIAD
jgi:glycosyltransferase involved in cell wall biosynthesis